MKDTAFVDVETLRGEVRRHYAEVATQPEGEFHFLTGRSAAKQVGYADTLLEGLSDEAVEGFAGVDTVIAARAVGVGGQVVGVDMTTAMLERARKTAHVLGLAHLEFRQGLAEELPIPDGWADLVISNGVLNLVPDKVAAYREVARVLRPGGRIQIADICVDNPVPESAKRDIDLWTG